ncbi:UDP-glycosyltransferase 83A1 [Vitis vinifera]|uniref:UDP-glycosyltransferase 83A1 n=1 Tax=Vitis vinifera TaxID=29760 RepID=A0A438JD50_VITVI|nr:UDP-glycosyltransferase 83A1 [Vitis vinifera]
MFLSYPPAQGHILPLMELSLCLVKHGFRITFVNTEFTHKRIVDAFVLESAEERDKPWNIPGAVWWGMGKKVEELIKEINRVDSQEMTCMVAHVHIGWALEAAAKMGIWRAAFWPSAAMVSVVGLSIPKLIDDGVIDSDFTYTISFFSVGF